MLDELKTDTVPSVIDTGFAFYGIPVGPLLDSPFIVHRKATGQELLGALKQIGGDRLILNSALAWGYGDCLALSKIRLYLELQDVSNDTLNNIFYENALSFFSQWRDIR
ncbi:MAG: hypothetical protein HC831_12330 [Chloroflexia bacterium]|nr:hypothetical protein [Chloroflexia bacterium]